MIVVALFLLGVVAWWAAQESAAAQLWWCTECQAWVVPIRGSQIGARCSRCGSGKVRPPRQGEDTNP